MTVPLGTFVSGAAPWPFGLAAAVATGVLLWPVGGRLGLRPGSRAAATVLFALAAAVIDLYAPTGINGWPTLLLAAAACLAVGGRWRTVGAVAACLAAVVAAPVTAAGALVLLGTMIARGDLWPERPRAVRGAAATGALAAAAAVVALGYRPELSLVLPPALLAGLVLWTLPVAAATVLHDRWLLPVAAALLTVLVCSWVPGPDVDAALLVAATLPVLTAVQLARMPALAPRLALAAAVTVATAASVMLILPSGSGAPAGAAALPGPRTATLIHPRDPAPGPTVPPVSLAIPALGVSGPLEHLVVEPDTGQLGVPDDPDVAGWWADGTAPGDVGPAVVTGHVDARSGPGVFHRLDRLRPGDLVKIGRADGHTVRFRVVNVSRFAKDAFPRTWSTGRHPGRSCAW